MPCEEAQDVLGPCSEKPNPLPALKSSLSEGSDSGYASTETTSDDKNLQRSCTEGVTVASRTLFRSKTTKLKVFRKEIPQHVYNRFYDLLELFSEPLYQYLRDTGVTPSAISIKLKTLGESEEFAKPWIVVMIDGKASKRARQFFKSSQIKSQCQPRSEDLLFPSFDVIVCCLPPRLVALGKSPAHGRLASMNTSPPLIKVYGQTSDSDTVCGSIVRVGEQAHGLVATLGGIIKIERFDGSYMLYAMTASHVVTPNQRKEDDRDSYASWADTDIEDEEFFLDEEEFDLEDLPNMSHDQSTRDNEPKLLPDLSSSTEQNHWWTIGRISLTSRTEELHKPNLDWALIAFHDPFFYRPNLLLLQDAHDEAPQINFSPKRESVIGPDTSECPVYLLGGPSGLKRGMMSSTWSYLMISPSQKLMKHFSLVLSDGSVVKAGDCGSWVVSEAKHEILGHVVASDVLGEAYVVPIHATFQDIKAKLSAKAVSLPSAPDIQNWLRECTTWLQEHPAGVPPLQGSQRSTKSKEAADTTDREVTSRRIPLGRPLDIHTAAKIEGYEFTRALVHHGENPSWRVVSRKLTKPNRPTSSSQSLWVKALHDLPGGEQGHLAFKEADHIRVVKTGSTDHWWEGELKGVKGNFPANYCQPLPPPWTTFGSIPPHTHTTGKIHNHESSGSRDLTSHSGHNKFPPFISDASVFNESLNSPGTEITRGTRISAESMSYVGRRRLQSPRERRRDTAYDHEIGPRYRVKSQRDLNTSSQSVHPLYKDEDPRYIPGSSYR